MVSMRLLPGILALVLCGAAVIACGCNGGAACPAPSARILFEADFEDGSLDAWRPTDPNAWRIENHDGRRCLALFRASEYSPPVRSPHNINIIEGLEAGSFVMELDVESTAKDYGHRDLCIFFGYQDPSHFYYAHLGKEADPHSHTIMVVDGRPRTSIVSTRTGGTPWDDRWHRVRLVRDLRTGAIEVYFDAGETPVMTATDSRFAGGAVGVGSFDDTGRFDNITVRALDSQAK